MKMISAANARAILDDFDEWRSAVAHSVETAPSDIRRAAPLVRRAEPKLLMPDAIHLATCQRLSLQLVTLDARLVAAAAARGFEVLMPA